MVLVETMVRSPFSRAQPSAGACGSGGCATAAPLARRSPAARAPRPRCRAPPGAPPRARRSHRGAPRTILRAPEPRRSPRAPAHGPRAPGARHSRLELALLRRRKQHVVEDEAIPGRVRVQRQVRRRVPDLVLLVLGIVAAEEGPRPAPRVPVDVLHPRGP